MNSHVLIHIPIGICIIFKWWKKVFHTLTTPRWNFNSPYKNHRYNHIMHIQQQMRWDEKVSPKSTPKNEDLVLVEPINLWEFCFNHNLKYWKVCEKKEKKLCFNVTRIAKFVIGLHKGKIYFRWNDASNWYDIKR